MAQELKLTPENEALQPHGSVEIAQSKTIEDAEWCFQFFNNEPVAFAWQEEGAAPAPLVLQIQPKENEGLNFQHNGMTFKIFSRPISEESKLERAKEKENAAKN